MRQDGLARARAAKGLILCVVAGMNCVGCGSEGAERFASGVAFAGVALATKAATDAIDDRLDRRRARAARRGGTPVARSNLVDAAMPLNEPGRTPSDHHLAVAFARMRPGLVRCAAPNSGRLIIEAEISGLSGEPSRRALFGPAADAVDPSCVDAQLQQIVFAPFAGTFVAYWTLRY